MGAFLLCLFLVLHEPNSGVFSPGQDISAMALWLVVPPSALLGIGILVGWIVRGFLSWGALSSLDLWSAASFGDIENAR